MGDIKRIIALALALDCRANKESLMNQSSSNGQLNAMGNTSGSVEAGTAGSLADMLETQDL